MKIVVFGNEHRVGALEEAGVVDLNEAFMAMSRDRREDVEDVAGAERVPTQLLALIERGREAIADARRALAVVTSMSSGELGPSGRPVVHDPGTVKLHAPWPGRRIACAGGNYPDHLARMLAHLEGTAPRSLDETEREARDAGQWGFWKVVDEVAGPDDPIPVPRRTDRFDYEAEVAIVLGRSAKDVSPDEADDLVWGFTLLNDWSIRDTRTRASPMSYNLAKNFDGCVSMGPAIVVGQHDPGLVDVALRVNGERRQSFNSSQMIFSFGEILAELSRDLTLRPGDVVSGGTAAGTAADSTKPEPTGRVAPDLFLKPGDVVELSSPQVGTMTNCVVAPVFERRRS